MKKIVSLLGALIMAFSFVVVSCAEKETTMSNEPITSFKVFISNSEVDGIIDHSASVIQLPGIKNGNLINEVSYTLTNGVTLYPDPNTFVGQWKPEMRIIARSDNKVKNYTIVLSDYEEPSGGIVRLDPRQKAQKIEFIGGDMERSQGFLQLAANPEEIAQWCFGDIHFDICRVSYDKKQELIKGEKNYAFYDNPIKSMQLLKKINPKIKFWATLKSDYNGYDHENNLPEWIYNSQTKAWNGFAYAHFLKEYLILMDSNGVHIDYMSVSKEWMQVISAEREIYVIKELNKACTNNKITPPLYVGPASWGISQGISFINQVSQKNGTGLYYGFCTHNYDGKENKDYIYDKFVQKAESVNKPAFLDEEGPGFPGRTNGQDSETMDGICGSYCRRAEFWKDGIKGELIFELFSRGVNSETRTIYFTKGSEAKRMRSYYVMKEYVNGIAGKGMYYVPFTSEGLNMGIDKDMSLMAFTNDDEMFVAVINTMDEIKKDLSIVMPDNFSTSSVERTVFEITLPAEGMKDNLDSGTSTISLDLPAKSVTFLNIKLKE